MPANKGIWVLAEQREGELQEVSLELMGEGRKISDELGEELCAVVLGNNIEGLAAPLAQHSADKIYLIDSPWLASYSGEPYADVLSNLIRDKAPRAVLCGATSIGGDLAPRLAARLKTGLVSNCVALKLGDDGLLLQTKPTYGGKVHSTIICPNARPQIATVGPGILKIKSVNIPEKAEIIKVVPRFSSQRQRTKTAGVIKADPKTIDLSEAEIIVAGGRGVGSAENFKIIEELADVLGGCVAGSRMAVDAGWVPSDKLVGQTGVTVTPRLYVACGISGALHHTLGMKDSRTIVAINTDGNAPIFKLADLGIIGNLLDVVPTIVEQLRELSRQSEHSSMHQAGT